MSELAKALSKAQSEFPKVEKNRTADKGKYKYKFADITDVIEAIKPVMEKHGLSFTQPYQILATGQQVLETQLLHTSGEKITSQLLMPDPSKMMPQEVGAVSTYFRRYALTSMLGIAADEDTDATQNSGGKPENKTAGSLPKSGEAKISLPKQGVEPGSLPSGSGSLKKISEAQQKRLWAIFKNSGMPEEDLRAMLAEIKLESTKDLNWKQYEWVIEKIEAYRAN